MAAPVAIVGGRPDGHKLVVEHELVPLHDQLMGSAYEVDLPEAHTLS